MVFSHTPSHCGWKRESLQEVRDTVGIDALQELLVVELAGYDDGHLCTIVGPLSAVGRA